MVETWKPVYGLEEYYEVSDMGRVRSKPRRTNNGRGEYIRTGKIICPHHTQSGYISAQLYDPRSSRKKSKQRVHKMVLEAFVSPRPQGFLCRHLDGNKLNNALSNLKWGTPKENAEDSRAHGTLLAGEKISFAKLNDKDVIKIRSTDLAQKKLADRYGVTQSTISLVLLRKTWKHI